MSSEYERTKQQTMTELCSEVEKTINFYKEENESLRTKLSKFEECDCQIVGSTAFQYWQDRALHNEEKHIGFIKELIDELKDWAFSKGCDCGHPFCRPCEDTKRALELIYRIGREVGIEKRKDKACDEMQALTEPDYHANNNDNPLINK